MVVVEEKEEAKETRMALARENEFLNLTSHLVL